MELRGGLKEVRHQPDLASGIKAGNQREVDHVKTYELMN